MPSAGIAALSDARAALAGAVAEADARAAALAAADAGSGPTPSTSLTLPVRLVDYFCVMVSAELPPAPDGGAQAGGVDGGEGISDDRAAYLLRSGAGGDDGVTGTGGDALDSDTDEAGFSTASAGESGGDSAAAAAAAAARRQRRIGRIQFRHPKADHGDCPLPESVDWFIFPNGITPVVQRRAQQARPPTRRSVFVLSNVSGATLGGRMYGCCLTAFRKETDDEEEEDGEDGDEGAVGGRADGGDVVWWPVVLFLLSRYPVVPQLQVRRDTVAGRGV